MASVVQNLVYRVSVSAIVGAIVAGGLIYLNNDRVVKLYRAEQSTQTEQQATANKSLMDANNDIAFAIGTMADKNARRMADLEDMFKDLEAKIDAIPAPVVSDYSEITAAIADLNERLSAQIEAFDAKLSATQEQN